MNKTILISVFICMIVFSQVGLASDSYQVTVRPKVLGNLQPSTTFDYEFLFTQDSGCSVIYKNATTSITTDQYGIGYAELDMSGLTGNPNYLCEIRDGSLRKVHNVSLGLFEDVGIRSDERYFFDNLRTKWLSWISSSNYFSFNDNINITGNVTAEHFIGDGSQLYNVNLTGASSYWNRTGTTLEPKNSGDDLLVTGTNIALQGSGAGQFLINDTDESWWFKISNEEEPYMDTSQDTFFFDTGGLQFLEFSKPNLLSTFNQNIYAYKNLSIKDGQYLFLNGLTNNIYLRYNSTRGATEHNTDFRNDGDIILTNNQELQGEDNSGTPQHIARVSSGNYVYLGNTNLGTIIDADPSNYIQLRGNTLLIDGKKLGFNTASTKTLWWDSTDNRFEFNNQLAVNNSHIVCTAENGRCNQTSSSSYWNRTGTTLIPTTDGDSVRTGNTTDYTTLNETGIFITDAGGTETAYIIRKASYLELYPGAGSAGIRLMKSDGNTGFAVNNGENINYQHLVPSSANTYDLGGHPTSAIGWRDLYLDGALRFLSGTKNLTWNDTTSAFEFTGDVCDTTTGNCLSTGGSGGNVTSYYFDAYDNTGGNTVTASWQDLNLTTERVEDGFTHTGSLPDVTVSHDGTYVIQARVSSDMSGTSRDILQIRLSRDTGGGYAEIDGSYGWGYMRNTAIGEGTATTEVMMDLNAGDKIKAEYKSTGVATSSTLADGSGLTIYNTGGIAGNDTSGFWSKSGTTLTPAISGNNIGLDAGSVFNFDFSGSGKSLLYNSSLGYTFMRDSNTAGLVISQAGTNLASYFPRSVMIGGDQSPAGTLTDNMNNCTVQGYNHIDCNTGTNGADLGVHDELEVKSNVYVGDSENYTKISGLGEVSLHGEARVYKHIDLYPYNIGGISGTYNGVSCVASGLASLNGFYLKSYDDGTGTGQCEASNIAFQLPDEYVNGTDIIVEIKWTVSGTTGNVVWGSGMANVSDGNTYSPSAYAYASEQTLSAGGTAWERQTTTFILDGSGTYAGDDVSIVVYRNADSGSDTYSGDSYTSTITVMYLTDRLGG